VNSIDYVKSFFVLVEGDVNPNESMEIENCGDYYGELSGVKLCFPLSNIGKLRDYYIQNYGSGFSREDSEAHFDQTFNSSAKELLYTPAYIDNRAFTISLMKYYSNVEGIFSAFGLKWTKVPDVFSEEFLQEAKTSLESSVAVSTELDEETKEVLNSLKEASDEIYGGEVPSAEIPMPKTSNFDGLGESLGEPLGESLGEPLGESLGESLQEELGESLGGEPVSSLSEVLSDEVRPSSEETVEETSSLSKSSENELVEDKENGLSESLGDTQGSVAANPEEFLQDSLEDSGKDAEDSLPQKDDLVYQGADLGTSMQEAFHQAAVAVEAPVQEEQTSPAESSEKFEEVNLEHESTPGTFQQQWAGGKSVVPAAQQKPAENASGIYNIVNEPAPVPQPDVIAHLLNNLPELRNQLAAITTALTGRRAATGFSLLSDDQFSQIMSVLFNMEPKKLNKALKVVMQRYWRFGEAEVISRFLQEVIFYLEETEES
jgi:hypothetical protein